MARSEVQERLSDPTWTLLNVLPEAAFRAAHIPGSLHLSLEEIVPRAAEVLGPPGVEIVVYCAGPT